MHINKRIKNMLAQDWLTKEMINILNEKHILILDVDLNSAEQKSIAKMRIENEKIRTDKDLQEFNHFGLIDDGLIGKLAGYFEKLGNNSEETIRGISGLVVRIGGNMAQGLHKEASWVCVRTSLPSDEYDIPRWHTDHRYFKSEEPIYKLVFTIKELPTRFAEKIDIEKYRQAGAGYSRNYGLNFQNNPEEFKKEDMRIRKEIIPTVKEIGPFSKEQAVIYLVGNKDAKVHSVPKIDQPRIFMSVVVGSFDEINEWKERFLAKKFL